MLNLLQMEYDVLPTKVLKEDKADYIQALIDTRESDDLNIFLNCMTRLHLQHLKADIDQFVATTASKMVDKPSLKQEMVDKTFFGRQIGRYFSFHGRRRGNNHRGHRTAIWLYRHYRKTLLAPAYRVQLS